MRQCPAAEKNRLVSVQAGRGEEKEKAPGGQRKKGIRSRPRGALLLRAAHDGQMRGNHDAKNVVYPKILYLSSGKRDTDSPTKRIDTGVRSAHQLAKDGVRSGKEAEGLGGWLKEGRLPGESRR